MVVPKVKASTEQRGVELVEESGVSLELGEQSCSK